MTKYGYRDRDGDKLAIEPSNIDGFTRFTTITERGEQTVVVTNEDAPTIALAILTAAGINAGVAPQEWADPREGAAYYLAEWVSDRAEEKARRAAEDDRIREWLLAVYPYSDAVNRREPISDQVRDRYRRSRDFFADIPF